MDSNNAFSVLMKKPLLKSANEELASSASEAQTGLESVHCDTTTKSAEAMEADKENSGDHHRVEIKTAVSNNTMKGNSDGTGDNGKDVNKGCFLKSGGGDGLEGLGANTASTKVNAFSRLMAPKGRNKNDREVKAEEGGEEEHNHKTLVTGK